MTAAEAFSLLTLPNATLAAQGSSQTGVLNLECITVAVPDASAPVDRDVYLLLRLDKIEAPIDPTSVVQRSDRPGWQTYTFRPTENNSSELVLSIPVDEKSPQHYLEDLETFESLLSQYAELRVPQPTQSRSTTPIIPPPEKNDIVGSAFPGAHGDLRGHLVAINEDTGEVIGQFDDSQFQVREDPKLHEKGHENDVVMIEVPDTRSGAQQDANALQMFVTAVPPEDQDWITKSAGMVSHAISTTTSLLLTTISTASNYYINHSKPSPHHPSQVAQRAPGAPPPPPSRTLVFLTSERTRRGLAGVHAVSGKAVEVSAKTVNKIDDMIRSAMGRKSRKPRHFAMSQGHRDIYANGASSSSSTPHSYPSSGSGMLSPQSGYASPMPRAPSPAGKSPHLEAAPPPYPGYHDDKAPSVRGRSPSPAPPLPPRTGSGLPQGYASPQAGPSNSYGGGAPPPLPPRKPLTKKAKALLSLDLILSTIDHEARRLLDGGQNTVGNVVGHKYGPEARETSMLMTGTAKHVGLVYIDMKGIGRRALLKKAGTHWVKGKLHSGGSDQSQQGQQWQGQGQQGGQGPYQQGPYQQQYQNMGGPSQGYYGYGQPSAQGKH